MNLLANLDHNIRRRVVSSIEKTFLPELWYLVQGWLKLKTSFHALDIGGGMGYISLALAKSGWKTTTADITIQSLVRAEERFDKAKLSSRFELVKLEKLPFSDSSFDAICCINTLEWTREPLRLCNELSRLLRPGGQAIISIINNKSPWAISYVSRQFKRDDAFGPMQFHRKADLIKFLGISNFEIIKQKDLGYYLPYETERGKIKFPLPGFHAFLVKKSSEENENLVTNVKRL